MINKDQIFKNNETNRNDQITLSYVIIISEDSRDVEDFGVIKSVIAL